jgi:hypothetical protein
MLKKSIIAAVVTVASLAPVALAAQERAHGGYEELGTSKDWTAIRFKSGASAENVSCSIFSRPKASRVIDGESEVDALRGEKAAFITWEDGVEVSRETGVASFLVGAPVVERDAGHQVKIDTKDGFDLYGFEDRVYTREGDDKAVLKTIRDGYRMMVRTKLSSTRETEDEYSLSGVQSATRLAAAACN